MRTLRLPLLTLALAAMAACSGTGPMSVQDARPSYDGSGMVGSGNRSESTFTTTTGGDSTTVGRGSGMVGSGN